MEAACNRFASAVLLISACLVSPFAKAGAISEPITGNAFFNAGVEAGFTIGGGLSLDSATVDWGDLFIYTEGESHSYEIPASGSFQGVLYEGSEGTAQGVNANVLGGSLDFFSSSTSVPIFSGAEDEELTLPVSLSGTISGFLLYPPGCYYGETVPPCFDFGPQVFNVRLTGSGTATFGMGGAAGGSPPQWVYSAGTFAFIGTAITDLTPEPDSLWLAVIGLACIAWRFSSGKRRLLRQSGPGVRL